MRRALLLAVLLVGLVAVDQGTVPCGVTTASPACWAALRPGPTVDALTAVQLDVPSSTSAGELLVTTVEVDGDLGLLGWLQAWRDPRTEEVPRDEVYPEGVDVEETQRQYAVMMTRSQQSATLAALRQLEYDLDPRGARVEEVVEAAPAEGLLAAGDVVLALDDRRTDDADALVAAVTDAGPGTQVALTVDGRGTGEREVDVTLGADPDAPDQARLGVLVTTDVDLPVDVTIDAGAVGGPSGGLVFALGIVDLLTDADLTGGNVVAGTGTITADGAVGPISGVQQKVVGATARDGARPAVAFLVPTDNVEEARAAAVERDVLLVPVATLDEAVAALERLAAGEDPADAFTIGPGA